MGGDVSAPMFIIAIITRDDVITRASHHYLSVLFSRPWVLRCRSRAKGCPDTWYRGAQIMRNIDFGLFRPGQVASDTPTGCDCLLDAGYKQRKTKQSGDHRHLGY
jgi:hypothetical protein